MTPCSPTASLRDDSTRAGEHQNTIEIIGNANVSDFKGAVKDDQEKKLRFWDAMIKHGVTMTLVLTLTVLAPIFMLVCGFSASEARFKELGDLFRVWFSALAGFAGIAIGFYFKSSTENRHGG